MWAKYTAGSKMLNLPHNLSHPHAADHVRMTEPSGVTSDTNQHGKSRKVESAATFLPCNVCGERAGKHSYYGGQVGAD